jgi:hypothetical protein
MNAKFPPGTLEKLWNDPANWRGRVIYHCKADPRLIVPKRIRWTGWTMNFAHPAAWWYLVFGIVFTVAVVGAGAATGDHPVLLAAISGVVAVSIVSGIVLSSPRRFERQD